MKAVHFGAGNIGRGFIGALLSQSNYETTFVDVNAELIQELNEKQSYRVKLAGTEEVLEVTNVSGLNSLQDERDVLESISQADLITTAVGPTILSAIAPVLAKGLMNRDRPVNVIACENMVGGSEQLKGHVLANVDAEQRDRITALVGFPNAAVDRIVPNQHQEDLLTVMVEPYYEWVVETPSFKGPTPSIEGITFVEDLTPYIERKLFTVNTGHAVAAYLGRYHGHQTIKQAMDDPEIIGKVNGALQESGDVLIEKYSFDRQEHQHYINTIMERFQNPDLSDEVTRVARGPIRKLGPEDRLVRPALEYIHWIDEPPVNLSEVIAAALLYVNDSDSEAVELQSLVASKGPIQALEQITELEEGHPLLKEVEKQLDQLKR